MDFERARLDIDGPVATLTLNHPEVMNAVSPEMLGGLMKAMDEVENPKKRHPLPRDDRRRTRLLHRRQPAGARRQ